MPTREGLLVVISGPAGSGKSSLVENLIKNHPGKARRSITATTRKPRPGEIDGRDYFFLERDEFLRMADDGEFLEYTEFNGNFYGTPRRTIETELAHGGLIILVIEVDGAESIKFFFPDAIFIFIIPPTPGDLRHRLERRGTESREDIERRLDIARHEMQRMNEYDFLIINDDLDTATQDLAAVIRAVERSLIFGNEMREWELGHYANWTTRQFL